MTDIEFDDRAEVCQPYIEIERIDGPEDLRGVYASVKSEDSAEVVTYIKENFGGGEFRLNYFDGYAEKTHSEKKRLPGQKKDMDGRPIPETGENSPKLRHEHGLAYRGQEKPSWGASPELVRMLDESRSEIARLQNQLEQQRRDHKTEIETARKLAQSDIKTLNSKIESLTKELREAERKADKFEMKAQFVNQSESFGVKDVLDLMSKQTDKMTELMAQSRENDPIKQIERVADLQKKLNGDYDSGGVNAYVSAFERIWPQITGAQNQLESQSDLAKLIMAGLDTMPDAEAFAAGAVELATPEQIELAVQITDKETFKAFCDKVPGLNFYSVGVKIKSSKQRQQWLDRVVDVMKKLKAAA